jgi:Thioesterase-like superfamily
MSADAFYELDGDRAIPSELTRGPWDPDSQHAGPPAALLGRALEGLATPGEAPSRIGRVTYEILKPVPIVPLRVEARIERDGRRVQMLSASLHAGEDEVMRARGWRLREEPIDMPDGLLPGPPAHGPDDGEPGEFFPTGSEVGYHSAVEYRFITGAFVEPGPATVWMRSKVQVVAGEEISPLGRVLVVADSGNGVSAALDWRRFLFINVDLTVHLHRLPAGEWVCLDAVTLPQSDGIGLADAALFDERGPLGRAAQTLLVAARG